MGAGESAARASQASLKPQLHGTGVRWHREVAELLLGLREPVSAFFGPRRFDSVGSRSTRLVPFRWAWEGVRHFGSLLRDRF